MCLLIIVGVCLSDGTVLCSGVDGLAKSTDRRLSSSETEPSRWVPFELVLLPVESGLSTPATLALSSHFPLTVSRLFVTRWLGVHRLMAPGPVVVVAAALLPPLPDAANGDEAPETVPKKLPVLELDLESDPPDELALAAPSSKRC